MNLHENFVITINRQFGTGGHAVGMKLAGLLGVKCIDKQILRAVAEKFRLTERETEQLESRRPSWWEDFARFYKSFVSVDERVTNPNEITSRQLFYAQARAMRDIAAKESCVVVGRCGFHVFANHPNKLRIYLHAPMEMRVKRIMETYHVDQDKARMMMEDTDYTREIYTKTYTHHECYDARNYDLCLDISTLGIDGTVDFLTHYMNHN